MIIIVFTNLYKNFHYFLFYLFCHFYFHDQMHFSFFLSIALQLLVFLG